MAGLLLIAVVMRRTGTGGVWAALAGVQMGWLVLALALVGLAVVISAHRWGLLLAAAGLRLPLGRLVRLYLTGLFAGNFLPSSVGGDVVRLWALGRASGRTPAVAASVVVERITGGWVLSVAALVALPVGGAALRHLWPAVSVLALVMAAISLLVLTPGWIQAAAAWAQGRGWDRLAGGLRQGVTALAAYRHRPGTLAAVLGWAVLFQIVVAAVNFALLAALGHRIDGVTCLAATALILAATVVPVSIGGLGIREAAYVTLFGRAGVPPQDAFAASLLFLAAVTMVSLPGGLTLAAGVHKGESPCLPPAGDNSCS